jgi:hypothetical protein
MADDIQRSSEDLARLIDAQMRAVEQMTRAVNVNNQLLEDQARAAKTGAAAFRSYSSALEDAEEEQDKLTKAQRQSAARFDESARAGSSALGHLTQGVMGAGRAMLDGKKGAAALNDSLGSLSAAATAAGTALALLIPGGPLIKGLIAGLTAITAGVTKYAQAANEMADKLYTGYAGMAKAGGAAADGMSGLFEDTKKLGLSMNELGDFVSIVTANSKDLALFGGSVFDGRKKLADMGKALEGNREGFIKMGLSMQDVTEGMVGYIKQQRVAGNVNNQTTAQLAEGARKYLMEQDALTKLTGMARQEQEAAREQIRSQERFAAKLEELRQQGRKDEAKALEDTYLVLYSQNKEAAQGFADISTNNVQTEAAQKSMMATQGESMRVAQQISAGQIQAAEGAQRVARAHGETATRLGATMGQIGTYNQTMGDLAGDLRLRGMAEQDIQKTLAKIEEDRKKQGAEGGAAADKMLDQQGKLRKTQIDANEAMERFVKAGIGPAQDAMIGLAKATLAGTESLNKMFGITPGRDADVQRSQELGQQLEKNNEQLKGLQDSLGKAKERGDSAEAKRLQGEILKLENKNFSLERGKSAADSGISGRGTMEGFEGYEQRSGGSLGAVGKLIEDFGRGTPTVLHGREGVITEDQLRQFGVMAMNMGLAATQSGATPPGTAPTAGTRGLDGASARSLQSRFDMDNINTIMENVSKEAKELLDSQKIYTQTEKITQQKILEDTEKISDNTLQSRLISDQDRITLMNFTERRKTLYDSILENVDRQFQVTKAPMAGAAPAGGAAATTPVTAAAGSGGAAAIPAQDMPTGGGAPPDVDAKDYVKFTGGTGSEQHFDKLADNVESAFLQMARDYNQLTGGKTLQVNSAYRSPQEQANVDSGSNPKAAPGMSLHNVGRALDIQSAQRNELEQLGLLAKYGFRPLAGDPPHISMRDGGIAHGPESGYPAELHGTEAVIPLGDGALTMNVPSVEALVGVTEEMGTSINGLRDEIRSMMTGLQDALGRDPTVDLQSRMIEILENINRAQNQTADASRRMAQAATN